MATIKDLNKLLQDIKSLENDINAFITRVEKKQLKKSLQIKNK